MSLLQDLEPISTSFLHNYHSSLALLSPYKDHLASLITNKKLSKQEIHTVLPHMMKLLSTNDEYLLMIIVSKHIFGKEDQILKNFFLAYCQSDHQAIEVSKPN